ncbi:MAG: trypsin-like peptidase domain-containing protein [Spirochaetaceae bacterium]|nr:trypsin-like peptidase domain-containing protein [Spirochaetaceae bacterium]
MEKKNFFISVVAGVLGATLTIALTLAVVLNLGSVSRPERVYAQENILSTAQINVLEQFNLAFNQLAEAILPSVVRIDIVSIRTAPANSGRTPWEFFFNQGENNEEREFRSGSLGTGFIIEREGNLVYILSNHHVVGNATEISITFNDGQRFDAELLGADARLDLAIIRADIGPDNPNIRPLKLGNSDDVNVGDWVLAIGSPFGFDFSVTRGIVSAVGRTGGPSGNINDFIQTDAPINQGNSGGPLVNIRGEVIGINNWIATQNGGSIGLGFSIPINNAQAAIPMLKLGQTIQHGWLGITINEVAALGGSSYAQSAGFGNQQQGAIVLSVVSGGPAELSGIRPGDLIISVNNQRIESSRRLTSIVGSLPANSNATIVVIRDGREQTINARIGVRGDDEATNNQVQQAWPGLLPMPLTNEIRRDLRLADNVQGVAIISVEPRTILAIAGLRQGDVITAIDGTAISSIQEFYRALNANTSGSFRFDYIRGNQRLNIGIERN